MRKFTMLRTTFTAVAGALAICLASNANANLVVNGDMEGGNYNVGHDIPLGWFTAGAASNLFASSDVSGTGGTTSLQFDNLNGPIVDNTYHDYVAITAGETYDLNFEYKTTGGGIYGVFNTNVGNIYQGVVAAESLVWTNALTTQVVAPVGATQGRWLFYGIGDLETIYLDNVSFAVHTVPEPGSMSLLGLGGLLMISRMRRRRYS